ncbi:peptide-binding protein [Enterococcus olivae]
MANLGAQKAKRKSTPITTKPKSVIGDKTARVCEDLHQILKVKTAVNGGNVKEIVDKALEE